VCLPMKSHAVFWANAPAPGRPLPLESASVCEGRRGGGQGLNSHGRGEGGREGGREGGGDDVPERALLA